MQEIASHRKPRSWIEQIRANRYGKVTPKGVNEAKYAAAWQHPPFDRWGYFR
jgi:hypothetical protein